MALPKAREGLNGGFSLYYEYSHQMTIGNREQIVWSSIKHLGASGVADPILRNVYRISNKATCKQITSNLKLYINQAYDFYSAAISSGVNTSPLYYYYCFLNLAKAMCEIKNPSFHKLPECYSHGISWRPSPKFLVNPTKELVYLSARGVWHVLWEKMTGKTCNIPNPTYLKVKDLFACCPETGIEYSRIFGQNPRYIPLQEPVILFDESSGEFWIKFSVNRSSLKEVNLSRQKFLTLISNSNIQYRQVQSSET
ncbi:unnamed protein product, partial [marine sediment metagenome]